MTIIAIGISFILIWLGTTFFIVRYVTKLKDDLLQEKKSESILGEDKESSLKTRPFDYIKRVDPMYLLLLLQQEHPQVIALVLSYLEPKTASVILQNLPHEEQSDVARRIACIDRVSPEVSREIERVLEKKLCTLSSEDYSAPGGIEDIVKILNQVNRSSGKQIIKALEDEDPELGEEIRKQSSFFRKIFQKSKSAVSFYSIAL